MSQNFEFQSLAEEVTFWETHDSAEMWDEMEEVTLEVNLISNLLHPRLITVTHLPDHCPRCQSTLEEITIDYLAWTKEQMILTRNVPINRCHKTGHEYILEATITRLLDLHQQHQQHKIQASEILSIPVIELV